MASLRSILSNTARFLFCALPGVALLLVVGPVLLLSGVVGTPPHHVLFILGGICAIAVGGPLTLYGTNTWGKWGYLLPFFSVPVVILPVVDFARGPAWLVLLLIPFGVAAMVRVYYSRKHQPPAN
jgi:hypothetical protein